MRIILIRINNSRATDKSRRISFLVSWIQLSANLDTQPTIEANI
jgi:hypothetical protein